jgi:hypothetical protein
MMGIGLLLLTKTSGAQPVGPPDPAGPSAAPVYLRLNQVGYLPAESKVALALTRTDLRGRTLQVVTEPDRSLAFSGTVGPDRGVSGPFLHLYELDFSGLTAPGRYRLLLDTEASPAFTMGAHLYAGVTASTLQFFRVQRCGNSHPLLHGVCHLKEGRIVGGPLDGRPIEVSGGWHDAGDYLKFVITAGTSLTWMLTAYQKHPEAFADEDRNGVPDVLDEARVGLDWLLKMWDPGNQVLYYLVGDQSDHEDWRMPEVDDSSGRVRPVYACEAGKGANVAGAAAAALALGAALWGDPRSGFSQPALAATYRQASEQIYAYGKARPAAQSDPFGFYPDATWQDDLALAAAELYRATGNPAYLLDARRLGAGLGHVARFDWADVHALAHYEIARLDPTYRPAALAELSEDLAVLQDRANSHPFRTAVDRLSWGSAEEMIGAALEALWYEDLSGDSV